MERSAPQNRRLTVPKTFKMMLVRPVMTNLKMTVRNDCTVSACRLPPTPTLSINALTSVCQGQGSWPLDRCMPPAPKLLGSEIKQTFLSTNLACLLAFEHRNSQTPRSPPCPQHTHTFSNKSTRRSNGKPFYCITLFLDVCKELII